MAGLCVRELHCAGRRRRPVARGRRADASVARTIVAPERLESRVLLAAAPVAAGPEFRVNTNTAGSQELFPESPHAVAADADGDFVVTWSSSGQDGSAWGVYAQRYAADGTKRGGEFRVNQATAGSQWYPSVAADADGDFVIVWTSAGQDGSGDGVYARRYSAAGAPLGNEFRVNTTTADHQRHATVSASDSGAFVVAWSGFAQPQGSGWDVYAQRFDASGNRQGGEFRANGTSPGDQQYAAVAVDPTGRFVITWTTDGQDGSGTAVYAKRYSAAGAQQGGEFRVNSFTAGNQHYSRVAADAAGNFVVAWASAGQDGSARGVYAQRYTAAGAKRGGEFRVNETTAGEQFAPTVDGDSAGGFVVTWTGADAGNQFGVFARAYDSAGASRGGEFRANTHVTGNQVYAAAASSADAKLVIVWQSDSQDGSFFGVHGQRYAGPDSVAPTADVTDVTPDPRNAAVGALSVVFSEPVTGVDRADFTLTRNGGANLLTASHTVSSADGVTWTIAGLDPVTAPDGAYVLTLNSTGTGITDLAGNALSGGASDQWRADVTRPTANIANVSPDPRLTPVESITIHFSEPVTGFDLSDLQLTRDGVGVNLLTPAQTLSDGDNTTFMLNNLAGLTALPGLYALTLVATGAGITDAAGNALLSNASDVWTVQPPPLVPHVVGRHVFYNDSSFDGRDPAASAADDNAIATDKAALLPGGGRAGFANYTTHPAGITGVMIDVADWGAAAVDLSPADFDALVGNSADTSEWLPGPRPASVHLRRGAGVNGSDRVTLLWSDKSVVGQWLQVKILANAATRLAGADVFCFGNLPGETGDDADAALVDGADLVRTRAALRTGAAPITSHFDHDRSGRVDARDLVVTRSAIGGEPLQLIGSEPSAAAAAATTSLAPRRAAYRPRFATSLLTSGGDLPPDAA